MKQLVLYTLILFFSIPFTSDAQRWKRYRYELLGGIGTTNVFGDMGGGAGEAGTIQDFDIEGTGVNIFVGMRYKLKELVYVKVNLIYSFSVTSDEFTDNIIEQHQHDVAKKHGYQLTDHCLYLYGLCKSCQ